LIDTLFPSTLDRLREHVTIGPIAQDTNQFLWPAQFRDDGSLAFENFVMMLMKKHPLFEMFSNSKHNYTRLERGKLMMLSITTRMAVVAMVLRYCQNLAGCEVYSNDESVCEEAVADRFGNSQCQYNAEWMECSAKAPIFRQQYVLVAWVVSYIVDRVIFAFFKFWFGTRGLKPHEAKEEQLLADKRALERKLERSPDAGRKSARRSIRDEAARTKLQDDMATRKINMKTRLRRVSMSIGEESSAFSESAQVQLDDFWYQLKEQLPSFLRVMLQKKTAKDLILEGKNFQKSIKIAVAVCQACDIPTSRFKLSDAMEDYNNQPTWKRWLLCWRPPPLPVIIFLDVHQKRKKFQSIQASLRISPAVVQKGVLMDLLHAQKLHPIASLIYQLNGHDHEAVQATVDVKIKLLVKIIASFYFVILASVLLVFALKCESAIADMWGVTMGIYLAFDAVVLPLKILVVHVILPRSIRDDLHHLAMNAWTHKLIARAPPPHPPPPAIRKAVKKGKKSRVLTVSLDVQPKAADAVKERSKLFSFEEDMVRIFGLSRESVNDPETDYFMYYLDKIRARHSRFGACESPEEAANDQGRGNANPEFSALLVVTLLVNRFLSCYFLVTLPFDEPHRDWVDNVARCVVTGTRAVSRAMRATRKWVVALPGRVRKWRRSRREKWEKQAKHRSGLTLVGGGRRRLSVSAGLSHISAKVHPRMPSTKHVRGLTFSRDVKEDVGKRRFSTGFFVA
jgi:hypothetical protein